MSLEGCGILPVDPECPDQEMISKAATVINQGGIVVFPTSTFYGIGAQAFDPDAVEKVFHVKGRDEHKPLLVLISSMADLPPLVRTVPSNATRLIDALWPGGITLVFDAADSVPPSLTGYSGKIGIRLASHPVASALVRTVARPVTGTSANLSGEVGCTTVANLNRRIKDQVDLVLDSGELQGNKGSTVVDVTVSPSKILREGVISTRRIRALFEV
jgi:L-threonylcarbamoyladenylate synthase